MLPSGAPIQPTEGQSSVVGDLCADEGPFFLQSFANFNIVDSIDRNYVLLMKNKFIIEETTSIVLTFEFLIISHFLFERHNLAFYYFVPR